MGISFWRYSATGNRFLFFDNRDGRLSQIGQDKCENWAKGAGVDGLIFLENSENPEAHFHMRYLNSDGGEVEMCGNGARSIMHFAHNVLKIPTDEKGEFHFTTMCSLYHGRPEDLYPLQMTELSQVGDIEVGDLIPSAKASFYLNTGVPHCVYELEEIENIDIDQMGAHVRYDKRFEKGANANFYRILTPGKIEMRTYERGVEGETESCGTGATAAALSLAMNQNWPSPIEVKVPGGDLVISFNEDYSQVFLAGKVELLENGEL